MIRVLHREGPEILAVVLLASSTLFGAWAAYMFVAATEIQGDPDAWGVLFLLVCVVLGLVGVIPATPLAAQHALALTPARVEPAS
ncbi:MAG: hypothetical protein M3364_03935 [Actinomycetota bacterium]|nr:hypothetical protein [Actinomycetota bacterium]